jgi:hypothetical protein
MVKNGWERNSSFRKQESREDEETGEREASDEVTARSSAGVKLFNN